MLIIEDAEHFSDESDRASYIAEEINAGAIESVRLRTAPEIHRGFDGRTCVDCGDAIPEKRLAMKRVRCVACQGD